MRNGDVFEEAGTWDHVSTVHKDQLDELLGGHAGAVGLPCRIGHFESSRRTTTPRGGKRNSHHITDSLQPSRLPSP